MPQEPHTLEAPRPGRRFQGLFRGLLAPFSPCFSSFRFAKDENFFILI